MPTYKGAEIIAEYLVKEEVPYLFGLCGHGIIGFLDAVYDRRDKIKTVSVHSEAISGFMADVYYRLTHQPVATFTSCGPGSAQLVPAIASAFQDSSAFLAITGNVSTTQFNRGPFQESGRHFQGDFTSVMRPYVKRSFQAMRPDMLPLMMRQSFNLMTTGRPGPVHLDVPFNVFVEKTDAEIPEPSVWRSGTVSRAAADPESIAEAAKLLLEAKRPVIVAGNGLHLSEAAEELRTLVEMLDIPVATTPLGKGSLDERHPLCLGTTGRNGTHACNKATRSADVILALGTRFDDRATSAWLPGFTYSIPPTKLIHVEIDPQELGRNYPATVGILGDIRTVLRQLIAELRGNATETREKHREFLAEIAKWKKEWEEFLAPAKKSDAVPIRPDRLVADLRAAVPENAVVLSDVGIHHNWLVQQWDTYRPQSLMQSWGFASMGFATGGALAAPLAAPGRPVVAVCGDGGFLMFNMAVATAVEYDLPVVWVIWNNTGYCSIRDQQAGFFGQGRELVTRFRKDATWDLMSPDFAGLARSMGADGVRVERPEDLQGQVAVAIERKRPCVVDVRVDSDVRPPATGSWDLPPFPAPLPNFGWDEE